MFSLIYRFNRLHRSNRLLLLFSVSIFFWAIFDGIITYFTPILITQRGFSNTQMGLIIASSSVFGAILDFILAKILKGSNYLRTLLTVIAISFFYPLTLWFSSNILLYLLAMFIWGLYWDLYRFVSFDFVAQNSSPENNCLNFSVINLFRSIALIIAPIIAGLLIFDKIDFSSILIPAFFLILAAAFYVLLYSAAPHHHTHSNALHAHPHSLSWLKEIKLISQSLPYVLPLFLLNIILVAFDSTIWTLGPLLSQKYPDFNDFGGLLMALYMLPGLFNSIYIEKLVDTFGKRRVAFFAFIISGVFLVPLFFIDSPWLILVFIFLSSLVNTSSWPAVSGLFTDCIEKYSSRKKEFESLNDLSVNIGFIIGPTLAGIVADNSNILRSISLVSLSCILFAIVIYFLSLPKSEIVS